MINIGSKSEKSPAQWPTNCFSVPHQEIGAISDRQRDTSFVIAVTTSTCSASDKAHDCWKITTHDQDI